jgi:hypothetical protein
MRNTDNGVIGRDQTAVMARLALDELIDQLLHSNALSLKLTANPQVADRAWHLAENTCIRAFSADDPQAKSARTMRCSSSISPGLPTRSRRRLPISFIRCSPGSEITLSLSGCGRKANVSTARDRCSTPAISSTNCALCQQHPASHHPLFDFLASEASAAQIDYFFKSDSALNLLFFDLVAMGLVGSLPETRAEIAQNLWDEIGQGSTEITHVNLYKDLLKRRNIALPDNHFAHLYEWQGLAGYNAFMLGGVNRQHYYKSLGVMAMTELLDPPQYEKLVAGCRRIGLSDRDVHYYAEHITVDIGHADGWLNNVIVPIGKKHPAAMEEVYFGAALRLQTCNDYYDGLLAALQSLDGSASSHSVPPSE